MKLSTHVLDTALGRPAAGLRIVLTRLSDGVVIADVLTNQDGRVDQPLLVADAAQPGPYEIVFHVGDYFRRTGAATSEPPFLDQVPVRFGAAENAHYHIPLLVSPYAYSTYRGS
ncbi:hydroxyisourate hydrolase [Alsobacter sp. KACC 23698]|uniref:5-hydroxyisourate hydrolase n=1 Tax=Alsobacter sp. KACC 23698 TaxID=3149229 RepID=A0AAU7JIP8_9HYPH